MIRTSSYNNWESDKYYTYSISGDCGKNANYKGKVFSKLAPKLSFWKIWHDNIGIIPEEENNMFYIEQYYHQVLSNLNPETIYNELDYSTLLCYEDNTEFCHRHIVSAWLEILLDIEIPECKAKNYQVEQVDKPKYIKEYLEDIMKKNTNMRGFKSLRALYLFNKSEKLEQLANELEQKDGKCHDDYRQAACNLRCETDETEAEYNKNKLIKIKKLKNK